MLSVGLCLSARLPAGLLVFLGFVSSFGSIDHRLQQFELLPCGAVQTVDFFDHIVGVGGCDPFSEFVPSLFRFGVMYHHFNGGTLSHGSLTSDYIAITSFLRVTGCPLFAAASAQNIQSQTDQQSHINDGKFGMFSEGGRKFIGLEKNSHVCLAIYDKYDGFGNLRSLQGTGIAAMVEPFSEEYNAHAAFKKIPLDALKKLPSPMNLICVTPTRIDALFSDFKKDGYSVRQVLHRLS